MRVLHITPHLGGGVGRAISGLIAHADPEVCHSIVCLESPEKTLFIDSIRQQGCDVICCPDDNELEALVNNVDVIQLEWWNHPATIQCLCKLSDVAMRLVVWSHISGLYNPIIPNKLMNMADQFVFTSPCSYEAENVSQEVSKAPDKFTVVASSGGFDDFPLKIDTETVSLSVGYIGSLNFSKLHPDYIHFLDAVALDTFKVTLIGDETNKQLLQQQAKQLGKPSLLHFIGYTDIVAAELSHINVLAYLLNPFHYGTTENALLESMAMGVVPVVLNNFAESQIVRHQHNGLIVSSSGEFAEAIKWLHDFPAERVRLGHNAAESVRNRFCSQSMTDGLGQSYRAAMAVDKHPIDFASVFGDTPSSWFLSCQPVDHGFHDNGRVELFDDGLRDYTYLEMTKGSVFHFQHYFPNDKQLLLWANNLKQAQQLYDTQTAKQSRVKMTLPV